MHDCQRLEAASLWPFEPWGQYKQCRCRPCTDKSAADVEIYNYAKWGSCMRRAHESLASLLLTMTTAQFSGGIWLLSLLGVLILNTSIEAQTPVSDLIGNEISVTVSAATSFNSSNGIYTYTYTVSNSTSSVEEVRFFAVQLGGLIMPDVVASRSPQGWTFGLHADRPIVSWSATAIIDGTDTNVAGIPPSSFQIKPGQTLGGFVLQSHAPPGRTVYYAQGYVRGPIAKPGDVDDEHSPASLPDFTQIGINGATTGPLSTATRGTPSVRGFVAILNPVAGSPVAAPVKVQVQFALDGETVDDSSFQVQLNGIDITRLFTISAVANKSSAILTFDTSPLHAGVNDLIATVSGMDPQTGATAIGTSNVSFSVTKTVPGDVNGDGRVDCEDVAIVKAAFGTKIGNPRFDSKADINGDGVIDIRDLSFVAQRLSAGTKCQ
jgi:hypothetical protein